MLYEVITQFNNESTTAISRLKEGVAPYTRYVRSERERLEKGSADLTELNQVLSTLRARSQEVLKDE